MRTFEETATSRRVCVNGLPYVAYGSEMCSWWRLACGAHITNTEYEAIIDRECGDRGMIPPEENLGSAFIVLRPGTSKEQAIGLCEMLWSKEIRMGSCRPSYGPVEWDNARDEPKVTYVDDITVRQIMVKAEGMKVRQSKVQVLSLEDSFGGFNNRNRAECHDRRDDSGAECLDRRHEGVGAEDDHNNLNSDDEYEIFWSSVGQHCDRAINFPCVSIAGKSARAV